MSKFPEPIQRLPPERRKLQIRGMDANGKYPVSVPQIVTQFYVQLLNTAGDRSDYFATCITCKNFRLADEHCELVNQRPPAKVIADGCPKYEDGDPIPF